MSVSTESAHGLYQLLASAGLPRPQIGYTERVGRIDASCAVAWPELRIGLSLDGDTAPDALAKSGWTITKLSAPTLEAIGPLLEAVAGIRFAHQLAASAGTAKRTISSDEQRLLAALMTAGLPMPDRNHSVKVAARSITPDFCWHTLAGVEVKVALELDGYFHHGGRDLDAEIKATAATDPARKKQLLAARKDQAGQDAAKRRALASLGWTVLNVMDTELAVPGATERVAADVARLITERIAAGTTDRTATVPTPVGRPASPEVTTENAAPTPAERTISGLEDNGQTQSYQPGSGSFLTAFADLT